MDSSQLLFSLLTSVGVRMPVIIALGVAIILLADAPAGRVRTVARSGLAVLLGAVLAEALLTVLPVLLVVQGKFDAVASLSSSMGVARFVVALIQAGAFVALAWALVHGLRQRPDAPR
ncbi:hypothetical protein ABB30_09900 [Stenotrophomonas ginsengisoli]|uniref:Transmembrane protein n=1 Tax=Stenotrophomonas ginsengisoli TaxID=336566 RepID=A0A0R0DE56_9GAMM|nr:hypothetical protein [Stenotrophomonas ginsengisoli]KRG76302.1 hypothetical protein ABB30_09900 [Stenotrophomonas ginsengisoli]